MYVKTKKNLFRIKLKLNPIQLFHKLNITANKTHTYKATLYALDIPKQSQTAVFNSFKFNLETNSFH